MKQQSGETKYQALAHATFAGFMPQGLHPAAWLDGKPGRWRLFLRTDTVFMKCCWANPCVVCRVLQPSKNPFIDTLRAVINDVKWFLFLLLLTMWGFCMSFYILFRRDQKKEVSIGTDIPKYK